MSELTVVYKDFGGKSCCRYLQNNPVTISKSRGGKLFRIEIFASVVLAFSVHAIYGIPGVGKVYCLLMNAIF